ncbi:hypothetical protein ACFX11_040153 [Malus domestica]
MSCDKNGGDAFCGLVEMGEKSLLEVRKVYLMHCYATSAGSSSSDEESDSDELDNNEAKFHGSLTKGKDDAVTNGWTSFQVVREL